MSLEAEQRSTLNAERPSSAAVRGAKQLGLTSAAADGEGGSWRAAFGRRLGWVLAVGFLAAAMPAAWADTGSAVSPDFQIKLYGSMDPATIAGEVAIGTGSSDSQVFALDLRGVEGPSDLLLASESSCFEINLLGLDGGLSVAGTVFDAATGAPLPGAKVSAGGVVAVSGAGGGYLIEGLEMAEYTLVASKSGYVTATETVVVPPGGLIDRMLALQSAGASGTAPRVVALTSKYRSPTFFLEGAGLATSGFPVTFTASVDWAGHTPGRVEFVTGKGRFTVATTGTTASREFDMAADFAAGDLLRAVAVSTDGARSAEQVASVVVMPNPFATASSSVELDLDGDRFIYLFGLNLEFYHHDTGSERVPASIPVFGGQDVSVSYAPEVCCELGSDGRAQLGFAWGDADASGRFQAQSVRRNHDPVQLGRMMEELLAKGGVDLRRFPRASFGGILVHWFPVLGGELQYNARQRVWECRDVFGGLAGDAEAKYAWPLLVGSAPVFLKTTLQAPAEAAVNVVGIQPWSLEGAMAIPIHLQGGLAVNWDEMLAVESWAEGGLSFAFEWPGAGDPTTATLRIEVVAATHALLWTQEYPRCVWELDLSNPAGGGVCPGGGSEPVPFQPAPRDYLTASGYATFVPEAPGTGSTETRPGVGVTGPLQEQVFPQSEPAAASHGTNLFVAWLQDEPQRTRNNRTLAVFSRYDGRAWTAPEAIADDGTADFHPQLLAFRDGAVMAAWEDEGAELSDAASFEDMKVNLDVGAAFYDPTNRQWKAAPRFGSSQVFDRSPRLAGLVSDNVLLAWIASETTEPESVVARTNRLWSARWDGQTWSAPRSLATVPYPVLKCAMVYDGVDACWVASVDTDGDLQTLDDHELLRVSCHAGVWNDVEWLTRDQVPDDNPQLTFDRSGNVILAWLRDGEVSTVAQFDFSRRQIVRSEGEYSSNLADFRLAAARDGRLALVWAEPSDSHSDLWVMFHDPASQLWGRGKPMTADPETERGTAVAFLGTDTLMAVYDRTPPPTNRVSSLRTDLYLLRYRMAEDPALDPSGLEIVPANPTPGDVVRIRVPVVNRGDTPFSDVPVAFYAGDPANGGVEIGRVWMTEPIAPGETGAAELEWTVPVTTDPTTMCARVDPDQETNDADLDNNSACLETAKADLAIRSISWTRISGNQLAVTVRVANDGALASSAAILEVASDNPAVTNRFLQDVPALAPGETTDLTLVWDVTEWPDPFDVVAWLDGAQAVPDFDTDNNACRVRVQRVVEPLPVTFVGAQRLLSGLFRVTVMGPAAPDMSLEASDDLVHWTPVLSTNLPLNVIEWSDPGSAGLGQRFYRAVMP